MSGELVPASDLPDTISAPTEPVSGQEVPANDLPEQTEPSASGAEVPQSDLPDEQKYSGVKDQLIAGAEGLAKGVAGPLATGFETKVLGVNPEDILGRQKANPWTHGIAEGVGNVAALALTPELEITRLGTVGSKALDFGIKSGLIQGGDEISNAMLGIGNPIDAAAMHIAGATGLGLVTGGAAGILNKVSKVGLKAVEDSGIGNRLSSVIRGIGYAAEHPELEKPVSITNTAIDVAKGLHDDKAFKLGQTIYGSLRGQTMKAVTKAGASAAGAALGGTAGAAMAPAMEELAERVVGPHLTRATKNIIGPMLTKVAGSGSVEKIGDLLNHATKMSKGVQRMTNAVSGVFGAGEIAGVNKLADEAELDKLDQFMEDGGIEAQLSQNPENPIQNYADGGAVDMPPVAQSSGLQQYYPEQDNLITTARGRISTMLKNAKPVQDQAGLLYDTPHKDPGAEKSYRKLLHMANNPLSIAYKIRDGSLTQQEAMQFKQMHPEVHQVMANKLTKKILEDRLKEEKRPKHKTRQALSLFLGTNLESSMTPAIAMAAQATFQKQASQPASEAKTSALKKASQDDMTAYQARTKRLNKD